MTKKQEHWDRDLEVGYWFSYPQKAKPDRRGFPKTETGVRGKSMGAAGALRAINAGFCSKVQLKHRPSGTIVWTAVREKVPGVANIFQAKLMPGNYRFKVKK
jgi:hypothetical protein